MNIMTKRGSLDNIVTYEHYCDSYSDLSNIPENETTLGSVAVIVNGQSGGLEVYMANSNKEWILLSSGAGGGGGGSSDSSVIFVHATQPNAGNTKGSSDPWVLDKTGTELAELIKDHVIFLYMENEDGVTSSYRLANIQYVTGTTFNYFVYIFTTSEYFGPFEFFATNPAEYPTTENLFGEA